MDLKALFGTTDVKVIAKMKADRQKGRDFGGTAPETITMTADECKAACDRIGKEYLPGYEGRILRYTVATEAKDRYGDIVRVAGCKLDNYNKNPVVMYAHQHEEFPVGAALATVIDPIKKTIVCTDLFLDNRVDDTGRSESVFKMAKSRMMPACSVGFMPIDTNRPATKEDRLALGLGEYGVEYKTWEKLEHSPCSIPANPEALQLAVKAAILEGINWEREDLFVLEKNGLMDGNMLDAFELALKDRGVSVPAVFEEKDVEEDIILRPYPNEHAARLIEPEKFDKFRRTKGGNLHGKKVPATISIIWGHLKDKPDSAWAAQALRFPTSSWTADEAKKWLKDNDISYKEFAPASGKSIEEVYQLLTEVKDIVTASPVPSPQGSKEAEEKSLYAILDEPFKIR